MRTRILIIGVTLAVLFTSPTFGQTTTPPVFETSNPICRTSDVHPTGVFVQVWMRAKLIDHNPIGHVTVVMHLWYTNEDDQRRYLNSLRNEVFVKDPNQDGTVPLHANNPDLDIRPGEIVGFRQDKFFIWNDVEDVRCGRMSFYHEGVKLPIVINKDWRYTDDDGWINEP